MTLPDPATLASPDPRWQPALAHSRYLVSVLASRPELIPLLQSSWEAPLTVEAMREFVNARTGEDDDSFRCALRRLRQRVLSHLILRDLCAAAPLAEIVGTMSDFADYAVNAVYQRLHAQLAAQYGEPLDSQGRPQRLIIIGMGKHGGRELNVSSDIDLIFVYPDAGETTGLADGRGRIDAFDFFFRLGKRLVTTLADITGDGQVFRVDMRLRPNGDSGPLVCSLDALENYFIAQGREWERYAWIKARVLDPGPDGAAAAQVESCARPFIFRKYLDFGAINAMRDLHAQIRREVARKDMADHVKLGPGGIREIEFIAQVFQLIRGGRDPSLQIKPTLRVLDRLVERRLMPAEARNQLAAAYDFLRRVEHRLQYFDDAQTHMLPTTADDRQKLALSMGDADYAACLARLDAHRAAVSRHFEEVFADPGSREENDAGSGNSEVNTGLWLDQFDADVSSAYLAGLGYADPAANCAILRELRASNRYQQLPTSNRERLDALGPRLIAAAAKTPKPDVTLARGVAFLEAVCKRGAYLALLQQYPQALDKLAEMIGASKWAADYLTRHPIVLDEMLDPRLLDVATDWTAFRADLDHRLAEVSGDDEREMDILREMHHAQVFRLLAQDLAGLHTLERISDHLTELADTLISRALTLCWGKLRKRHRDTPRFAVIGFGKLGGKELGYGSDLDLVFLYDDDDQSASEIYARLGQRMNTWLSSQTAAGTLFETDMRLRPNGDSGLIASSIEAFREYELEHAWLWEHQALTRARFCAGDAGVGARFEAIRIEILRQQRDLTKLREEVVGMRQKMLDAHATRGEELERGDFDVKHDPGGIIDVEFIVQYLILGHARSHPELCGNFGNIALLRIAADCDLIPHSLADPARDAYREFRRLQHRHRLDGSSGVHIPAATVAPQIDAVRRLWKAVMG